jgi:hypothetical protein
MIIINADRCGIASAGFLAEQIQRWTTSSAPTGEVEIKVLAEIHI